jgi:hypothetical protein
VTRYAEGVTGTGRLGVLRRVLSADVDLCGLGYRPTLLAAQAAPHAVGDPVRERVVQALAPDEAVPTELLRWLCRDASLGEELDVDVLDAHGVALPSFTVEQDRHAELEETVHGAGLLD